MSSLFFIIMFLFLTTIFFCISNQYQWYEAKHWKNVSKEYSESIDKLTKDLDSHKAVIHDLRQTQIDNTKILKTKMQKLIDDS